MESEVWIGAVDFKRGSGECTLDVWVEYGRVSVESGRGPVERVLWQERPRRAADLAYLLLAASVVSRTGRPSLFEDRGAELKRFVAPIRKYVEDRVAEARGPRAPG